VFCNSFRCLPSISSASIRRHQVVTCVVAVDELLLGRGSGFDPAIVAVLLKVLPAVSTLPSCTVNLMVAPLRVDHDTGITVPTLQLTVPPVRQGTAIVEQLSLPPETEQLTLLADTLTKVVLAGSTSVMITSLAVTDPTFATPIR
jgi:hypothetical protein